MRWSLILHGIAVVAGIVGVVVFIGSWIAGSGTLFGLSQEHLFEDAKTLLLVSIAFGIGTLIHQNEEKKS